VEGFFFEHSNESSDSIKSAVCQERLVSMELVISWK
jgi:hypothetical protein